jgi:hypothetical protein
VDAWWLWVRTDAARRLRPALVLMLLVALAGGVVLAAVAGGRRNGSAVERATALTSPGDVIALPNQVGFDWDAVRALPEVAAVAEFPLAYYLVDELPPDVERGFPAGSPEAMTEVEVPLVVEGRLPDPDRVDEIAISTQLADQGFDVGDQLTIRMLSQEELAALFAGQGNEPANTGPEQPVTVVGITKVSFFANSLHPTFAFYDRYRDNLLPPDGYVNAVIQLRRGAADVPAFTTHITELAGQPVEIWHQTEELKRRSNATHLERDALYGFAVAAALAALILVGQAVVRMVASSVSEVPQLVALGFTRGGAAAAIGALPAAAAVLGALGAAGVAYVLSDRFPIGLGRQDEPHLGFQLDWAVIAPGVVLIAALALGGTVAIAGVALRRRRLGVALAGSRIAALVGSTSAPVPLAMGVRLALERGNGRTGVPVRPALVGSIVGVLGVVAALTFGTGLDRATNDARMYGQPHDAELWGPPDFEFPAEAIDALAAQPDVDMVVELRNAIREIDGRDVSITGGRMITGHPGLETLRGRLPAAPDEIALAPQEMDALGLGVGDEVSIEGAPRPFTVTAESFSLATGHTAYDAGGQVTDRAMRDLVASDQDLKFHAYFVGFTPGTDVAAAVDRLNQDVTMGNLELRPPIDEQENLKGVRRVPLALGAFLAVLAVGAVGHALASTVRRRRHDVAVLRVLGLTRRQARTTVAWQATTLALVGLVFGVPLGVAAGRIIWRMVAEQTPMLYAAPFTALVLVLVPPAAIVLSNALAAWPGHLAARLRPAESLRTE